MERRIIVAITGASGMVYPRRLMDILGTTDAVVDIVISENARGIISHELAGPDEASPDDSAAAMAYLPEIHCTMHEPDNLGAPISSGSVKIDGMVIVPCSMTTLGKIASGIGDNLITRAAGVMLKEHRKLIVVSRETPLSSIHIDNMLRLSQAGAVILPACPGFYHQPQTVGDVVDSIVARILDHLEIAHDLNVRWRGE